MEITLINSKTKLYGIIGNPVEHSLSPVIHNHCFEKNNINAVYCAFKVDDLNSAISGAAALQVMGLSITIPHKIEVMKFCNKIDPLAQRIGSVNTLVYNKGAYTGYNTDGYGAYLSLINNNIEIKDKKILILGNGGSARAIAFTLKNEGAIPVICGRNTDKIRALANDLDSDDYITFNELTDDFMKNMSIIINTTPIGMTPDQYKSPIRKNLINKKHVVFDIIYAPHDTALLKDATESGCTVVHGISMLINQAVKQFELWTGITPSDRDIYKIINPHLQ